MVIAKEILVVTEHQKQITTPQHHVHFHKGYDAGMACHGLCNDDFALVAETNLLYPGDEIATVARTENVHHHHHHPQTKGCGHDEIFGFGNNFAVLYFGLNTITASIIKKKELYPASPKEQTTQQSPNGLPRVALDEHANNNHDKANKPQKETGNVHGRRLHGMLHDDHERMT